MNWKKHVKEDDGIKIWKFNSEEKRKIPEEKDIAKLIIEKQGNS